VADSRHSPTYKIVDRLGELHAIVVVHDPFIEYDERLAQCGVKLVKSIEDAVADASLLIVATDHTAYKKIDLTTFVRMMSSPAAVVDGRNVVRITQIPKGLYFTGIGMKTINTLSK
jgi:UDP-N-acetyl-D-mannosaminuronate dehydrogenase